MVERDIENFALLRKAHELVMLVYRATQGFPREETFGLRDQVRRAVVSVPSNVVEGKARGSSKDYRRFLLIARGSLEEVNYQMLLSRDLGYVTDDVYGAFGKMSSEVGKLLNGVIRSLG